MTDKKDIADHVATAAWIAALADWLPIAVAALSCCWYLIRIGEWLYGKFKKSKVEEDGK